MLRLKRLQSELERVAVFESPCIEWEQYPTPPHLAAQIVQLMHRHGDVEGKAVGDLGVGCGILTIAAQLMGSCYNVTYDIDPAATAIARQNFSSFDCEVDVVHVDVETMRRWTAEDMGEAEEEERMEDDSANTTAGRLRRTGGGNKGTSRCGGRGGGRGSARPRPRTQTRTRAAQPRSRRESDSDSEGDEESPESPPPPPPSSSSSRTPSSHSSLPPCVLDTVVLNPPFGTRHSGVDVTFLHVALQLSHHSVYSLHKTSTRPFFRRLCEKWGVVGEVVAEMRFELKRSYSFHREKSRDVEVDLWRFTFSKDLGRPDRFSRKGHSTAPPTSQPPSYS